MYNPDYPSDQTGGFLQHTYQGQNNNQSFYWNGGYGFAGNQYGYGADSRRNAVNPVNPFNTFGQVGAPNNAYDIPESAVQPFGTYPPAGPQQNMGLNAMIDSRRNMGQPNIPQGNNPWAQPTPQTQAVFGAAPTPQYPQNNPFADPYYSGYCCGVPNDPNTRALYGDFGPSFDRHNSWDNYLTDRRQIQPPVIDWRSASNPNSQLNNQWNNSGYMQPAFFGNNGSNPGQGNMNWNDIAAQNWNCQR